MKALYRKYRPTKFSDVVGQSQVSDTLEKSLVSGKINHAYLFIGPRGTGKTSVARILAHAVNNFNYQLEDRYLDIVEIDAASNTGVDNIRELREKAIIAPTKGKYKVYIIDEIHMLSRSAANALLKTLEEPPAHVIFIMATTEANKVPITISSRTQTFTFSLVTPEIMLPHLQKIAHAENIPITDEALTIIAHRGGGSFRDTLSLLDQIATLGNQEISADIVNQALGLPSEQTIAALLTAHTTGDLSRQHKILYQLLDTGLNPETIASELINRILLDPQPAQLPLLNRLTAVSQPFPEAKLLLALAGDTVAPSQPLATPPAALDNNVTAPAQSTPAPTISRSKTIEKPTYQTQPASSPTPQAEPISEPTEPTSQSEPKTNDVFNWKDFLAFIRRDHEGAAQQLGKCQYELENGTLHIYPENPFTAKLLSKPENNTLLTESIQKFSPDINLELHSTRKKSPNLAKDTQLSQISDIMGDVEELKSEIPF